MQDQLLFYLALPTARVEAWSADMLLTFKLLNKLGVMSSVEEWVSIARKYVTNTITNKVIKPSFKFQKDEIEENIKRLRKFLSYAGIVKAIDEKKDLVTIAQDVIQTGTKDDDTIIYRLAMMIYHSARLAGQPAVKEIEDPGAIYLQLVQNENLQKEYPEIFDTLHNLPPPAKSPVTKTFICFIIATYIFYLAIKNILGGVDHDE